MSLLRVVFVAAIVTAGVACHQAAPKTAPAPAAAKVAAAAGPAKPDTTKKEPGGPAGGPPRGGPPQNGGAAGEPAPKPYDQVVKGPDLKTKAGLFKTHRIGTKVLYEIPKGELNKDMLFVIQLDKTVNGAGYGGEPIGKQVVRWERRDHRVLLRGVDYEVRADPNTQIARAVEAANVSPIIAAYNVEAYGPDSAPVIDVTKLFMAPPPELGLAHSPASGQIDAARSFLERVSTFPTNIEVEATLTVSGGGGPPGGRSKLPPSSTIVVHWSMVKLPEVPMMPRLADNRVGYFTTSTIDFSRPEHRSQERTFITRYRLECSDRREGNLCYPRKPITYYVDPATPTWIVPWIKKSIEAWKPAFEEAGFKDAIVAKDAPTPAEDPEWSPEDARYSVIRWLPSTTENAMGPNVHDPRSGEIINADVQVFHNIMKLQRSWYWTQVGALDPRAKKLPLPDSLMGRLLEYVVTHEIGHTLGLMHNMRASAMYPVDSVRNKDFVHRMGHVSTLMDYSRFNYVAQPEDHIALDDLIPRVGPYDRWAIRWAYTPIANATTPDEERPTLDTWAREQDTKPWLRFGGDYANGGFDPSVNTEAVGDADPVKSATLGIKNIKRLVPMLVPAATEATEDNADITDLYGDLVGQWSHEVGFVTGMVGGVVRQEKYGSQPGSQFTPIPVARQREAVKFLQDNVFTTPTFLLDKTILGRLDTPTGAFDKISGTQKSTLGNLYNDARMSRLIELELFADKPGTAYPLTQFIADVHVGIWRELSAGSVTVDPYRRRLQHNYVDLVAGKVSFDKPAAPAGIPPQLAALLGVGGGGSPDIRALFRMDLKKLDGELAAAAPKAADAVTRAHVADLRAQIDNVLNPKK